MVNPINMIRIIFFFTLCLVHSAQASQLTLTASVDRNPVMERESFVFKIEANDSVNTNDLDLSKLISSGFIVGRTATGSQTQIINGNISKTTTWSTRLIAKDPGEYVIPSFSLNGATTQPIKVTVVKKTANTGATNESIFVKNQIENRDIYVQQSVKLTTQLYISPQVDLQSGSLSEPRLEGAFIQQQGKDKDGSEIINGVRYRVIERIYTITPQSSGDYKIESPTFNGDIVVQPQRRQRFSSFVQSKPVTAFGEDYAITVRPIPDNYQGAWLPSSIVQLNEEWSSNETTFEVGEPITRTITLTALNVNEEQLPEVSGVYPKAFKVYPDQSNTHSVVRQNALVSQRINSEAIVANKPGTYTLPEIKVAWFNTKMKRQDWAILPARTVTVTGSEQVASVPNNKVTIGTDTTPKAVDTSPLISSETTQPPPVSPWLYWLALISGWLAFIASMLYNRIRAKNVVMIDEAQAQSGHSDDFNLADLKRACNSNQPQTAYQLLNQWLYRQHPDLTHIDDIKAQLSPKLTAAIAELQAARFGLQTQPWQGQALWKAIQSEAKIQKQARVKEDLPELN